jgi:hypothetical protein
MISTTWQVLAVLRDDPVLQHLELGDIGRVHVAGHVERVQHPLQKLAAIAGGVGDQPDLRGGVEDGQQLLQKRRLACAHLAGDTVMGARVITPYSRTEKARLWAGDQ